MTAVDPFSIAKSALQRIGEFKTPPTPEVFEVWYRYIEGQNGHLSEHLDYAIHEAESVDSDLLLAIHRQHCQQQDMTATAVSQSLAKEIGNVQQLLNEQKAAGSSFGNSVELAGEILASDSVAQEQIVASVKSLACETAEMRAKFEEMSQKLSESQSHVNSLERDLHAMNKALLTDHLTGVGNRRHFDSVINQVVGDKSSEQRNAYLAVMDLDHFKEINDTFGHDTGDHVIQFVAKSIADLKPGVPLSRLGGDEFAAVLICESNDAVNQFDEEIRSYFARKKLVSQSTGEPIGSMKISIGIAKLRANDDAKSWVSRADQLLYEAKNLGRNRSMIERSHG